MGGRVDEEDGDDLDLLDPESAQESHRLDEGYWVSQNEVHPSWKGLSRHLTVA